MSKIIENPNTDAITSSVSKPVEKICSRCETLQNVSNFARNTKTADGYLNSCLACSRPRNAVKRSLRSMVNAKCKACLYDPIAGSGTWRQQVEACTSGNCDLYEGRPTSGGNDNG